MTSPHTRPRGTRDSVPWELGRETGTQRRPLEVSVVPLLLPSS